MKLRKRGKPRFSPFLVASTLSAASLTLISPTARAQAQSPANGATPTTPSPQTNDPVLQAAQAAPQADQAPTITDIIVIGNKQLNKDYIIAASGAKIGDRFTPQLQADMVSKLLATGDFGANLPNPEDGVKIHSEEPTPPNGTCKVVIEVNENPTIQNFQITGAGPVKPEEVKALLHFKPGSVYSVAQFRLDVNDISDLYNKRGYNVTVGQDVYIDDRGVFHIPLVVTRISQIKIVGLHKTRQYVVLREMQTKQGDYLNTNTLLQDRIRLLNLDLFDDVNLSTFTTGPGEEGVTVNVVEKRTGMVTAGVGYSDRAQLIGFAEVTESNFRGSGESVNLRAETGGVVGRTSVELGFNEPYLDRRHTALNVQLYDKTIYRFDNNLSSPIPAQTGINNRFYNEQRIGTTLTVSRPIRRFWRAALTLRAESVNTDPLALPPEDIQIVQDGPIFVGGGSLLHDTRDLDLDPAAGGFQTLSLEAGHANLHPPSSVNVALPGVFGSVNFVKSLLDVRQYFSLSGRRPRNNPTKDETVLALRGIVGASTGTLPFFEQFFVGGVDNLRGYRDDRFWGNTMAVGSIEFRQPIAPKFKGVLFLDIGDAWGGPYNHIIINGFRQSGFRLHYGIGPGIRVVTPIGPLRLDYGFGDEGGRIHFSIGPTF